MDSSIDPFSNEPLFCNHCDKAFDQWEDLLRHKQQRRNDDMEDHIHCKICARDFKTLAGEMRHMQVVSQPEGSKRRRSSNTSVGTSS